MVFAGVLLTLAIAGLAVLFWGIWKIRNLRLQLRAMNQDGVEEILTSLAHIECIEDVRMHSPAITAVMKKCNARSVTTSLKKGGQVILQLKGDVLSIIHDNDVAA